MTKFRGYGVWSMGLLETYTFLVISFHDFNAIKYEADRIVEWFKKIK